MKIEEEQKILILYTLYILEKRYHFSLGRNNLKKFLRGSIFPTIQKQHLYVIPTYGSLRDSTEEDIDSRIRSLIKDGSLARELFPSKYARKVLVLTDKGKLHLKEKYKNIKELLEKYFKYHYISLIEKGDKYLGLPNSRSEKGKEKRVREMDKKQNKDEGIPERIDEKNIHLAFKEIEDDLNNGVKIEGGNGLTLKNAIRTTPSFSTYEYFVRGWHPFMKSNLGVIITKSFFKIFKLKYLSIEEEGTVLVKDGHKLFFDKDGYRLFSDEVFDDEDWCRMFFDDEDWHRMFFEEEYDREYTIINVDNKIRYYFDMGEGSDEDNLWVVTQGRKEMQRFKEEVERIEEGREEDKIHLAFGEIEKDLNNLIKTEEGNGLTIEIKGGNGLTLEDAIRINTSFSTYESWIEDWHPEMEKNLGISIIKSFFKISNLKYLSIKDEGIDFDEDAGEYCIINVDDKIRYYFDSTETVDSESRGRSRAWNLLRRWREERGIRRKRTV